MFGQNVDDTPPSDQHVCVGANVSYTVFGFPGSTLKWYIETNYLTGKDVIVPNNASNVSHGGFYYNTATLNYTWDQKYYTAGHYYMLQIEEVSSVCSGLLSPGLKVYIHVKPAINEVTPTHIVCAGDKGRLAISVTPSVPSLLQLQYRLVNSSNDEIVAWGDGNLTHSFNNLDAGGYKVQIRYVLDSENSIVVNGSFSESSVVVIDSGDNVHPTVSASEDVVTTTSADGVGNCDVDVSIIDAIYNDNCTSTLSWVMTGVVNASGSGQVGIYTFPIGITTITYTNTDGTNSVTDDMMVRVTDDEIPVIVCPEAISQNTDPNDCIAKVIYDLPDVTVII